MVDSCQAESIGEDLKDLWTSLLPIMYQKIIRRLASKGVG